MFGHYEWLFAQLHMEEIYFTLLCFIHIIIHITYPNFVFVCYSEPEHSTPRKKHMHSDLTSDQEECMCDWLEVHPIHFNKKLKSYKDTSKKERLWGEQAEALGKDTALLRTWFKSLHTCFGRLRKQEACQCTIVSVSIYHNEQKLYIFQLYLKYIFYIPGIEECKIY